jgi:hypothetical protein
MGLIMDIRWCIKLKIIYIYMTVITGIKIENSELKITYKGGTPGPSGLPQYIQDLINNGWTIPTQANNPSLVSNDSLPFANIGSFGEYTTSTQLSCLTPQPKCSLSSPFNVNTTKCVYNDDGTLPSDAIACPLAVAQNPHGTSACNTQPCYQVIMDNSILPECPTCKPSKKAILVRPCDGPAGSTFEGDDSRMSSIRDLCPYTVGTSGRPICTGEKTSDAIDLPDSPSSVGSIISSRTGGPQHIKFIEADCHTGKPKY